MMLEELPDIPDNWDDPDAPLPEPPGDYHTDELGAATSIHPEAKDDDEDTSPLDRLRLALLYGDDIKKLPQPEPLIDGIFDSNTLSMNYGRSGAGKTFTSIDWSLCVATGTWWHGHAVTRQRVLYVVAEGAQGFDARVNAWQQANNIYDVGDIIWLPLAINLYQEDTARTFAALAHELRPGLIVFDTLARCMVGADENSAKDMGRVIAHLDLIRRTTQACVLGNHHTGKADTTGLRGHSSLEAACDTVIECKSLDDNTIELAATKQKNRATGRKHRFTLAAIGDSCALRPATAAADIDPETMPATGVEVLQALHDIDPGGGVPLSTWRDTTKVSRSHFYRWRKNLLGLTLVSNVGTDKQPRYVVSDQGKRALGLEQVPQVS